MSTQLNYLKFDLSRYFYPNNDTTKISFFQKLKIIITTQGIWAIVVYRLRRWCSYESKSVLAKFILKPIGLFLHILVEVTTGIHIEPEIDIGPGFYIGHFGNIFIGGNTRVGKFFNISQECTSGFAGRGDSYGLPEIGDFVYLAPGAKVIGKIKIGNYVAVGANAVVTKDVPDNAVVVGVPGKIISFNSSREFILFNEEKCKEIL